jgi:hypothetical protein
MCLTAIMMFAALALLHCQDKRLMAGLDIMGIAGGEAAVSIEYGLAEHWSIGGEASYGFGLFRKGMDTLESSHRQEFSEETFVPLPDDLHRESIYARYWPTSLMKGPYMLTSICHGSTTGTDFCIGAGYMLHIWKSIYAYTEYRLTVSEPDSPGRRLSAGICLTFGK